MSTFVLMKILESSPYRYDRGIRILTLGGLDAAYERLTSQILPGQTVLDIGCGTGALTIKSALRRAVVQGIDINPEMLEIARKKCSQLDLLVKPDLVEKGIAELDDYSSESFDIVTSGLCFSELSKDELKYTLRQAVRILKTGGLLLVADEIKPDNLVWRGFNGAIRLPLVIITYLLTQTTTRGVKELPDQITQTGFQIKSVIYSRMKNFVELTAQKIQPGH